MLLLSLRWKFLKLQFPLALLFCERIIISISTELKSHNTIVHENISQFVCSSSMCMHSAYNIFSVSLYMYVLIVEYNNYKTFLHIFLFQELVSHYKSAVSPREKNALIIAIAMITIPTDRFIEDIEAQINPRINPLNPLLLAYGAVAANAHADMQKRMVLFLIDQIPEAKNNETTLVHLIHSIGNTKSLLAMNCIIQFVESDREIVQIATITAIQFFTGLAVFQDKIISVLQNGTSVAIVSAVIDALSDSFVHDRNMHVKEELHNILLNVSLTFNNHQLKFELKNYFELVGSEQVIILAGNLSDSSQEVHSRNNRDCGKNHWTRRKSDYNSTSSQSFRQSYKTNNPIAPRASEQSDVNYYPYNLTYSWEKKFGRTRGNFIAYVDNSLNFFAGVDGDRAENFKVFGRGVVRGHIKSSGFDIAKIETFLRRSGRKYTLYIYFKISGIVLMDETVQYYVSSGISMTRQIFNYNKKIVQLNIPMNIYGVHITFGISANVSLNMNASLSVKQYGIGTSATVSFLTQVALTAEGSVSHTFLVSKYQVKFF